MFGIIGSGFGLYAHLPAIAEVFPNETVLMPERYMSVLTTREELRPLISRTLTVRDEQQLLETVDKLVVSTWPLGQEQVIKAALSKKKISTLVLEKPLASSPERSKQLLEELVASGKRFVIDYSFLHCDWYKWLKDMVLNRPVSAIRLTWNFRAHHYKHRIATWKRNHAEGGGAIRFYGIHLLAVLTDLGFSNLRSSRTEGFSEQDLYVWDATVQNAQNAAFHVLVNSNADEEQFTLELSFHDGGVEKRALTQPFSEISNAGSPHDPRVQNLKALYLNLDHFADRATQLAFYAHTNTLWENLEKMNQNILKEIVS